MKLLTSLLAAALFAGVASGAAAQVPAGYPADYAKLIAEAKKEGKLVVYSSTDTAAASALLKDFEALYGIKVEYNDMNTTELYNRVISEKAAGGATADAVWSSSMDLQVKLVNDGYALTYASPEIPKLPGWAVWKDEAYGTTYEPLVFVYNKRLLKDDEIPKTHADFTRVITEKADRFKGKVTTYDIEKSGVGFLLITQDSKINSGFWDFAKALGNASPRFQSSAGTMMERVGSGENLLGYNIFGSYAMLRAKKDPGLGYVIPKDYALVMSRVLFINKAGKNPNTAKLWLDYLLSQRGQTVIANQAELGSIRADVDGDLTEHALTKSLGNVLKPIPLGPGLLAYLDQAKRLEFIKQWQQTGAKK